MRPGAKEMLPDNAFWSRLAFEAKTVQKEEPSFKPMRGDIRHWKGFLMGTGVYEGGVFQVEITLSRKFPFEPPKVRFLTKIWHPNIYRDKVCVGILGKDWVPTSNIVNVIETIRFLLNNPNPHNPLNTAAANQMIKDLDSFMKKAREFVMKHATWAAIRG